MSSQPPSTTASSSHRSVSDTTQFSVTSEEPPLGSPLITETGEYRPQPGVVRMMDMAERGDVFDGHLNPEYLIKSGPKGIFECDVLESVIPVFQVVLIV